MSEKHLGNHLVKGHCIVDMITFTLEVNYVNVLYVGKPSVMALASEDTRELTMESNHINAICEEVAFCKGLTLETTIRSTLERSHANVTCVGKSSVTVPT